MYRIATRIAVALAVAAAAGLALADPATPLARAEAASASIGPVRPQAATQPTGAVRAAEPTAEREAESTGGPAETVAHTWEGRNVAYKMGALAAMLMVTGCSLAVMRAFDARAKRR